jgi:hypothetical protein
MLIEAGLNQEKIIGAIMGLLHPDPHLRLSAYAACELLEGEDVMAQLA